MKLDGLFARESLRTLLRVVKRESDQISVPLRQHAQYLDQGWEVIRVGKHKVALRRERPIDKQLELDVWKMLYEMEFSILSGEEGVALITSEGVRNQVDVVAHDEESAIVVECKSSSKARRLDFQSELAILGKKRDAVRTALNRRPEQHRKLKVGGILATRNVIMTEADLARAKADRILVLDDEAIQYYLRLTRLIGGAARYQLLGELFQGQEIEGLRLKVPAVEFKMGDHKVYNFAISPENLLKVAYVAHRARNDLGSYQRMVQGRRLSRIRQYIDEGGIFPTNVVINFNRPPGKGSVLNFEQGAKLLDIDGSARLGHLIIPARYQSAWIIDGQHRLLAYSGHRWANSAALSVTAFDGLEAGSQAELFVRVNSEQKKVQASHLEALFATLNWDSDDPRLQVRAIISQLVQDLRVSVGSVFRDRILLPDEERSDRRCVTLKAIADELKRPGLFIRTEVGGNVRQFGVLWYGDPGKTLERARIVVEEFFGALASKCQCQWDLGDGDGGLVATNRGVVACIRILREVLEMVQRIGVDVEGASAAQLGSHVRGHGEQVGEWFASLGFQEVSSLRKHYGAGAPAELAFRIADHLQGLDSRFAYPEIDKWREDRSKSDSEEAKRLVDDIERRVRDFVVATLQSEFGPESWWKEVPQKVRVEAVSRREAEGEDHPREMYLLIMHYREIILAHWSLFEDSLGHPRAGSKDARTKWIVRWNDIRNRAFHASGARLKVEDVAEIREIESMLSEKGV